MLPFVVEPMTLCCDWVGREGEAPSCEETPEVYIVEFSVVVAATTCTGQTWRFAEVMADPLRHTLSLLAKMGVCTVVAAAAMCLS